MTANDLMMFLIDLHMQGNPLEDIEVSFRSHRDADPEQVLFAEEGVQREDGTPMEIMFLASHLDTSMGDALQSYIDSI